MTVNSDSIPPKTRFQGIKRRIHEFGLIAQDPILMIALIFSIIILTIFIFFPIFRTIIRDGNNGKTTPMFSLRARLLWWVIGVLKDWSVLQCQQ